MSDDCLFCKLASGKMGAPFLFENSEMVVVRDIHPAAKVHLLVITKKHIATVNDLGAGDEALTGRMVQVARDMATKEGIAKDGYRLVFNVNADGGQVVFHIHLHLLGGQKLGRMG